MPEKPMTVDEALWQVLEGTEIEFGKHERIRFLLARLRDERAQLSAEAKTARAERDRLRACMQKVWGEMARSYSGESLPTDRTLPSWIAELNDVLK